MNMLHTNRREALQTLGVLAVGAAGLSITGCAQPQPLKWSTGTERPRSKAPANATDCHHHIYDARFPLAPNATLKPGDAFVADYRALQVRIGTSRNVIVQPSTYGIDNRLLVESIAAFGQKNARGVAVVNTSVTDAELKQLHEAGVRGIRFNLAPPGTTTLDMVRPLAQRIAPMGWHVQVNAPAAALLEAKATWSDLPVPVVFDHLGRVLQPGTLEQNTFAMVRELVQRDKAWVKISGFYLDSKLGAPTYADAVQVATTYAKESPERVVWGSDWPHPTEQSKNLIPNDAALFDLLSEVVPNEAARNRVLVDNPGSLYQFG
ncbi:MAG TPA: amidohydrolase family protein [Burkholderiaceae bacterium]|nr:amidohydrolase family protein [Burkholderiaceae bacterium]